MSLRSLWRIGREVLVNFALPYLIYNLAQPRLGDATALIASSGPPILWSVVEFARNRRIDALSMVVLLGIGLSLLAFLGGGSVRFLQLREKLVTAFVGIVFLGSAAIGRPLMYEFVRAFLARANDPELQRVESLRNNSVFKAGMTIMTLVWGVGLLADAAASIALVYVLSIRTYLVVNSIMGYATIASLTFWNLWFGGKMRRKGDARLAAAQALSRSAKPASLVRSNRRALHARRGQSLRAGMPTTRAGRPSKRANDEALGAEAPYAPSSVKDPCHGGEVNPGWQLLAHS